MKIPKMSTQVRIEILLFIIGGLMIYFIDTNAARVIGIGLAVVAMTSAYVRGWRERDSK